MEPVSAVSDAKARLAAIVDSSEDAIIAKDLQGTIQSWNPSAERIFGYSAHEAIGQHIRIIIPDHLLTEEDQILSRVATGERIAHYQTVRRRKDGRLVSISLAVSPIRNAKGTIVGASKIARDITDQRVSAEARARLAAIVESSDDAIVSKNLDGIILTWNPGAVRVFGYTPEEAIGRSIKMLIPLELHGEEDYILGQIRSGNRVAHYETKRRRKDGTLIDISLTVSPMRDASGTIIGASKIARDVTEQKAARRALAELNQHLERRVQERTWELQRAIEDLQSFNSAVSHDLRTPLRAITGFVQLVLTDDNLTEAQRSKLNLVLDSSREMTRITEGLLRLSRVQRAEAHREPVDLSALATRIITRYQAEHTDRKMKVQVEPGLTTQADPALAEVVLENLLANAYKFTSGKDTAQIHVGQKTTVGRRQFFVKDNGIGFSEQEAAQLFRPFQRLRPDEFEGLGIGLATVRRIVSAHGGELRAEGKPGEGATFWFDFGSPA